MVVGPFIAAVTVFTVTVALAVEVQLAALVTVTVYVVVVVGETDLLAPVPKLLLQAYCVPPLAVRVWLAPLHIAGLAGVIAAVGLAFTVTCLDAVAVQLAALVTVTV